MIPLGVLAGARVAPATGPVSVVEVASSTIVSAATVAVTLATTPQTGDVVVVMFRSLQSTIRTASSISGLGATWTRRAGTHATGPRMSLWTGTGATAAGTLTLAQNTSGLVQITAYLVRGLTSALATGLPAANNQANQNNTVVARNGQFVVFGALWTASTAMAYTLPRTPATSWVEVPTVTVAGAGVSFNAYRVPTEVVDTNHVCPTSGNRYTFVCVVGAGL